MIKKLNEILKNQTLSSFVEWTGFAVLGAIVTRKVFHGLMFHFYEKPELNKLAKENEKAKENMAKLNSCYIKRDQLLNAWNYIDKERQAITLEKYHNASQLQRLLQKNGIEPACVVQKSHFNRTTSVFSQPITFFNTPSISLNQPIGKIIQYLTDINAEVEEKIIESEEDNSQAEEFILQQAKLIEEHRQKTIATFKNAS